MAIYPKPSFIRIYNVGEEGIKIEIDGIPKNVAYAQKFDIQIDRETVTDITIPPGSFITSEEKFLDSDEYDICPNTGISIRVLYFVIDPDSKLVYHKESAILLPMTQGKMSIERVNSRTVRLNLSGLKKRTLIRKVSWRYKKTTELKYIGAGKQIIPSDSTNVSQEITNLTPKTSYDFEAFVYYEKYPAIDPGVPVGAFRKTYVMPEVETQISLVQSSLTHMRLKIESQPDSVADDTIDIYIKRHDQTSYSLLKSLTRVKNDYSPMYVNVERLAADTNYDFKVVVICRGVTMSTAKATFKTMAPSDLAAASIYDVVAHPDDIDGHVCMFDVYAYPAIGASTNVLQYSKNKTSWTDVGTMTEYAQDRNMVIGSVAFDSSLTTYMNRHGNSSPHYDIFFRIKSTDGVDTTVYSDTVRGYFTKKSSSYPYSVTSGSDAEVDTYTWNAFLEIAKTYFYFLEKKSHSYVKDYLIDKEDYKGIHQVNSDDVLNIHRMRYLTEMVKYLRNMYDEYIIYGGLPPIDIDYSAGAPVKASDINLLLSVLGIMYYNIDLWDNLGEET